MNVLYQSHHTIGGDAEQPHRAMPDVAVGVRRVPMAPVVPAPPATTESAAATDTDAPVDTEASHYGGAQEHKGVRPTATAPSSSAVYQRRAQAWSRLLPTARRNRHQSPFRVAMAAYQGKATHAVPESVVEDIRQLIEASARHLLDLGADEDQPLQRYKHITRVHVMGLLRANPRHSKYYRDSHYVHFVITKQPPPNITEIESVLTLLFGVGISRFFCTVCLPSCIHFFFAQSLFCVK